MIKRILISTLLCIGLIGCANTESEPIREVTHTVMESGPNKKILSTFPTINTIDSNIFERGNLGIVVNRGIVSIRYLLLEMKYWDSTHNLVANLVFKDFDPTKTRERSLGLAPGEEIYADGGIHSYIYSTNRTIEQTTDEIFSRSNYRVLIVNTGKTDLNIHTVLKSLAKEKNVLIIIHGIPTSQESVEEGLDFYVDIDSHHGVAIGHLFDYKTEKTIKFQYEAPTKLPPLNRILPQTPESREGYGI